MTPAGKSLPSLSGADWLIRSETQIVFAALASAGIDARAVGGSVRNSLLGLPVKDIDIATPAEPAEVMAAARAAGLKTFETGLKHGTITLVAGQVPFEVTTLRRDEDTDGRHARVVFTQDWAEDAKRRDFTINALYCDAQGQLYDPLGGYPDIVARRVRFIGSAHDRIREDYLRILRFFRFTSDYAEGEPDAAGLAACQDLKQGISTLSGERLRSELLRILVTPRAANNIAIMNTSGLLDHITGVACHPSLLARMIACEDAADFDPDPILRLGSLVLGRPGVSTAVRKHLRLSNPEYERLSRMAMHDRAFMPDATEHAAKAFIYRHGPEAFRDGVMLTWAKSGSTDEPSAVGPWTSRLNLAQSWSAPELPVNGTDVMALGLASGPGVGQVLSAFEDWWIAADFPAEPAVLAAKLNEFVKVTKA